MRLIPKITEEMRRTGLTWRKIDGQWHEVCNFCGGNCGQCGLTGRIGNIPASMDTMVNSLYFKERTILILPNWLAKIIHWIRSFL